MKKIIYILSLTLCFCNVGCHDPIYSLQRENKDLLSINARYNDTIQSLRVQLDSLNSGGMAACAEENHRLNDSLVIMGRMNDTLSSQLFLSNYKIEKVKFYLAICLRDKTQDKFLKGWVRRAVE